MILASLDQASFWIGVASAIVGNVIGMLIATWRR